MRQVLKDLLEPFSYLIYALAIFLMIRKRNSKGLKRLLIYYVLALPYITWAVLTRLVQINVTLYNCFFIITVTVFSGYFLSILRGRTKRAVIGIIFLINLVLFIKADLLYRGFLLIHTDIYAATYLSFIIYTLMYFENVITNVNERNLLTQFDFWLVSGYLLYFFSSFFIILFYDNIDVTQRALIWSLQNVILFLSSLVTLFGSLWIYRQKEYF